MTFCVGLRTNNSLVAISDTRLTSGEVDFVISSKKLFLFEDGEKHSMFIMTSGLKSISDMVITYLNERKDQLYACDKLYQGVDLVAKIIRELRLREEEWIKKGGLEFEINYIVGGQFPNDKIGKLFRIYPEGSWKRVSRDTPFEIIGEGKYGKPILDRAMHIDQTPEKALVLGLLAFDSTRKSYPLCNPPLDVIQYENDSFKFKQKRLTAKQIDSLSQDWNKELNKALDNVMKSGIKLAK